MTARRRYTPCIIVILALALALPLTACSRPQAIMVDEGNSYDMESVAELQSTIERPGVEGSPVSEASALRREALIALRSQDSSGAELAEFITKTLPDNGRSVPYYGEAAIVNGTSAWILLELWGAAGETLDHVRIWVFDRATGDILFSSTLQ